MDYSVFVDLLVELIKQALPIGFIFALADKLVHLFLGWCFPKRYSDV